MKNHRPDYPFLMIVIFLTIFGLVMIASAGVVMSQQNFHGDSYAYLKKQLINGVLVGAIFCFAAYLISYRFWRVASVIVLLLCIILLVMVFIPKFGFGYGNARRWLDLKIIAVQPSEFVKLGFVIYLASWLDKRAKEVKNFADGVFPFLVIVGIIGGLIIMQPDIGTVGILALTALTMYFAAGAKLSHIAFIILTGVLALFILVKIAPYRAQRLTVFLNPSHDVSGAGYQLNQSLIAIGSGGFLGLGPGQSRQKFNYLPEPIGDSIFAIIGEELGYAGALTVVALFVILVLRGLKVARAAPDKFGKLLAVGIVAWVGWQALINIGAMSGLLPLTGVPLPFISYGGSALASLGAAMGIILNISRSAKLHN